MTALSGVISWIIQTRNNGHRAGADSGASYIQQERHSHSCHQQPKAEHVRGIAVSDRLSRKPGAEVRSLNTLLRSLRIMREVRLLRLNAEHVSRHAGVSGILTCQCTVA